MIFEYTDYRKYLLSYIKAKGRGIKNQIAVYIGCKPSYLSQILSGNADFNNEQSIELADLLQLSDVETEYLLTLIGYARAGSKKLKEFYLTKIKVKQEESLQLKNRKIDSISKLSEGEEFKYFSRLDYSLVNLLVTIPKYQKHENIIQDFGLTPNQLEEILQFLLGLNLIEIEGGKYKPKLARIHVPHDANIISAIHTNWRINTMKALPQRTDKDLHYSVGVTISKADQLKIKKILVKAIDECKLTIKHSEAESLYGLCVDFYEFKK